MIRVCGGRTDAVQMDSSFWIGPEHDLLEALEESLAEPQTHLCNPPRRFQFSWSIKVSLVPTIQTALARVNQKENES